MARKTCEKRVKDCFERWVVESHRGLDELKGSAKISEAYVTPFCLLLNFKLHLDEEYKDFSLMLFTEIVEFATFCVKVNDLPEVSFILKFWYIYFGKFASQWKWQLLFASGWIWWIHTHKNSKLRVTLSFHDVCPLIEKDVIALYYCCKFVKNRVRCKIDLI